MRILPVNDNPGFSPVTDDPVLNERLIALFLDTDSSPLDVIAEAAEHGITPPVPYDEYSEYLRPLWIYPESDGSATLLWLDPNVPVEPYDREMPVSGTADQIAALHRLRNHFHVELDRRCADVDRLWQDPFASRSGVPMAELWPRNRDYDLAATAQRMGISPPNRHRRWEIAIRHDPAGDVFVWHDWGHHWPLSVDARQHDLLSARYDGDGPTSEALAAGARELGIRPPFSPDLAWTVAVGFDGGLSWTPPYDLPLRFTWPQGEEPAEKPVIGRQRRPAS